MKIMNTLQMTMTLVGLLFWARVASGQSGTYDDPYPCDQAYTSSGSADRDETWWQMGQKSGIFKLTYDMYDVPDSLDVYYDGHIIFTTGGQVSGSHTVSISFGPGSDTRIKVVVNDGGNAQGGTFWTYQVECATTNSDGNGVTVETVRPWDGTVVSPDRRFFTLKASSLKKKKIKLEVELTGPGIQRVFDLGSKYLTGKEYGVDVFKGSNLRLSEGVYSWRARATTSDGKVGDWSVLKSFTVFGGVDISQLASRQAFEGIRAQGWSFVIVDAWGGHTPFLNARANLLHANEAGFTHLAAYCFLNFDNKATKSADGLPVPANQTGTWQINQALLAAGLSGNDPIPLSVSFVAVDVEAQWKGSMTPASRVQRIKEAVDAVRLAGLTPIIYGRNDNKEWDSLTKGSEEFSDLSVWVPRYLAKPSPAKQWDDLLLDARTPWQPFGGWALRSGKQYAENVKMSGVTVDLNVFDPSLFGVAYQPSPKVLLLLHGMNSNPDDAWNHFVQERFNLSAPVISGGLNVSGEEPIPDSRGVVCYRVDFGRYDGDSGRLGIEEVSTVDDQNGDFSTFETLGREVKEAVNYVLNAHPKAKVALLGHSRGGLAARAFLQEPAPSLEKASVVALLTTGTPHKGSPLGRLYQYYDEHPRASAPGTPAEQDWELLDELREHLDVRRPTISDLASGSAAIDGLNATIGNLPVAAKYGAITYSPVEIGTLQHVGFGVVGFDVSVWEFSSDPLTDASVQSRNYVLGEGNLEDNAMFLGDGIVPFSSQGYKDISGFPPAAPYQTFPHDNRVLHVEESRREVDISEALNALLDWWR